MLSRTADSLYWLARYVERAEYTARLIDVAYRLSSLPASYGGGTNEWEIAVASAGCRDAFLEHHGEFSSRAVMEFLAFSPNNPSSIANCFELARSNARSVRTALTTEMWSTINDAWLRLKTFKPQSMNAEETSRFLDWVKSVSLVLDGSAYRTMLRNDAYAFSRIGLHVERADNTARILDVKYHVLLPEQEHVGGGLDYFQWTAILRAVSALTAYHWVYKQSIKPWLVADLLILNAEMPRSLAACYDSLSRYLDQVADFYGETGRSQQRARDVMAKLDGLKIGTLFQTGLHEFIAGFIQDNNRLAAIITEQYLA